MTDRLRLYLMTQPIVMTNPGRIIMDPIDYNDVEEIASDLVASYRRMYPGIRKAWLRSARQQMSKRAWRRLRGKVKGLDRGIR